MNLYVKESFVDKTRGGRIGDTDIYESRFEKTADLYRYCLKEYGKCTGKVHVDTKDGKVDHVGWTFLRSERYEDDPKEKYLREVWVTVHDGPPKKTVSYQYHEIGRGGR